MPLRGLPVTMIWLRFVLGSGRQRRFFYGKSINNFCSSFPFWAFRFFFFQRVRSSIFGGDDTIEHPPYLIVFVGSCSGGWFLLCQGAPSSRGKSEDRIYSGTHTRYRSLAYVRGS